jgi:sugar O-acyltransferase (sialic acid O-acetyltransferase NeuD family)
MKKCVIIGAGTYGEVYVMYLSESYEVIGFIDDDKSKIGSRVGNLPVLGDLTYLLNKMDASTFVFVPIGDNSVRVSILETLNQNGFNTPSFIHPDTQIHPSVIIGNGVYILPSTSIMPFTTIADYTMISMGVNIAHHVNIEKGCFFSQGSNIGASIEIKEQAYMGIASTVMTGVNIIGKSSLIGAGAVIIKDVPDGVTVVGNPGREV